MNSTLLFPSADYLHVSHSIPSCAWILCLIDTRASSAPPDPFTLFIVTCNCIHPCVRVVLLKFGWRVLSLCWGHRDIFLCFFPVALIALASAFFIYMAIHIRIQFLCFFPCFVFMPGIERRVSHMLNMCSTLEPSIPQNLCVFFLNPAFLSFMWWVTFSNTIHWTSFCLWLVLSLWWYVILCYSPWRKIKFN